MNSVTEKPKEPFTNGTSDIKKQTLKKEDHLKDLEKAYTLILSSIGEGMPS